MDPAGAVETSKAFLGAIFPNNLQTVYLNGNQTDPVDRQAGNPHKSRPLTEPNSLSNNRLIFFGRNEAVDYESGRKGAEKRKRFAALFDDAAKRKFDCVLFWALDRLSREGMAQTITHLQRLSSYGAAVHSDT